MCSALVMARMKNLAKILCFVNDSLRWLSIHYVYVYVRIISPWYLHIQTSWINILIDLRQIRDKDILISDIVLIFYHLYRQCRWYFNIPLILSDMDKLNKWDTNILVRSFGLCQFTSSKISKMPLPLNNDCLYDQYLKGDKKNH